MRRVLLYIAAFAVMLAVVSSTAYVYAHDDGPSVAQNVQAAPQQQGQPPEANLPFLFAVFIITWAAFFAYIFFLSRRQREMQREIDLLKRVIEEKERESVQSESSP